MKKNKKCRKFIMWFVLLTVYAIYYVVVILIMGIKTSDIWKDVRSWFEKFYEVPISRN